jgi:O-antigen ligase
VVEWKFALGVITENPVFGIGFNTFGFLAPRFGFFREGAGAFHLAGDLLVILMMTGVIGFCLYLVMCRQFLMAAKALVQTSSSNWDRALGAGIQAATIGVICSSFFNTLILYPQVMGVLWTLWSLPPALLKPLPVNEMNYQYRSALSPSMIRQEGRIPSFSRASMR